jgi:hypothetical protein
MGRRSSGAPSSRGPDLAGTFRFRAGSGLRHEPVRGVGRHEPAHRRVSELSQGRLLASSGGWVASVARACCSALVTDATVAGRHRTCRVAASRLVPPRSRTDVATLGILGRPSRRATCVQGWERANCESHRYGATGPADHRPGRGWNHGGAPLEAEVTRRWRDERRTTTVVEEVDGREGSQQDVGTADGAHGGQHLTTGEPDGAVTRRAHRARRSPARHGHARNGRPRLRRAARSRSRQPRSSR